MQVAAREFKLLSGSLDGEHNRLQLKLHVERGLQEQAQLVQALEELHEHPLALRRHGHRPEVVLGGLGRELRPISNVHELDLDQLVHPGDHLVGQLLVDLYGLHHERLELFLDLLVQLLDERQVLLQHFIN